MNDDQMFSFEDRGSIAQGFFMGLGLTVLQAIITFVVASIFPGKDYQGLFIGIGGFAVIQLCWAIPFFLYLRKRGKTESSKGLIIETAAIFLISATCWLAMM